VQLTPTPSASSAFTSWAGCASTNGSVCTVTMSAARTVTATFASRRLTVTKVSVGGGAGTVDGPGFSCGQVCFQLSAQHSGDRHRDAGRRLGVRRLEGLRLDERPRRHAMQRDHERGQDRHRDLLEVQADGVTVGLGQRRERCGRHQLSVDLHGQLRRRPDGDPHRQRRAAPTLA
jgi:hypothetical protein